MEREKMSSESHPRPVRIFLVFHREDQKFRDDMNKQLVVLRRNETIDKCVFKYERHKDEVAAVTWSPDSTQIASACKDGTFHVWQAI